MLEFESTFLCILQLSGEKRQSEADLTYDSKPTSVGDEVAVSKKKRKMKPDNDATTSSTAQFVPHDYSSVNYKEMLQGDLTFAVDFNLASLEVSPFLLRLFQLRITTTATHLSSSEGK